MMTLINKGLFLFTAILFFTAPYPDTRGASVRFAIQEGQVPRPCEEVATEMARFKDVSTTWGETSEGDPQSSTMMRSAEGEWVADSITIYTSKSHFKKRLRQIKENSKGATDSTAILDERGRQIGQRVVQVSRVEGRNTNAFIMLITDRKIRVIHAPSLNLALSLEKANVCRAESERRLTSRSTG